MSGIGHLGELAVMEHVAKALKLPVYLPVKDTGIDFVAGRGELYYEIQVKTSTFQKNSYFWFDLHRHKLVVRANTLYVFVCYTLPSHTFMGLRNNFLVVPSTSLKEWIDTLGIASKASDPDIFNVFVYPDEEKRTWTYRNKGCELDWTHFWNNWPVPGKAA